jgi:hypothetical protein
VGEYATLPLYNIKAVVQTTGISPSTLRAWERRYNIAQPQRSDSGYRLYTERDVAIICWLKAQVDAGMSISQAVSWLGTIMADAGHVEQAILPMPGSGTPLHDPIGATPLTNREQVRDFRSLQHELFLALANYDEADAESIVAEAFSMYPVELVGEKLFVPILTEIGERRERGELTITSAHFANNYLLLRLGTLLRSLPNRTGGPLIWVGCARSEPTAASALLLGIYLRRSGYHIHYLGKSLPVDEAAINDFLHEVRHRKPSLVLFSVTNMQAAEELGRLTSYLTHNEHFPTLIGYCGPIFNHRGELRAAINGVFVGANSKEIVHNISELLSDKYRLDKRQERVTQGYKSVTNKMVIPNT